MLVFTNAHFYLYLLSYYYYLTQPVFKTNVSGIKEVRMRKMVEQ